MEPALTTRQCWKKIPNCYVQDKLKRPCFAVSCAVFAFLAYR